MSISESANVVPHTTLGQQGCDTEEGIDTLVPISISSAKVAALFPSYIPEGIISVKYQTFAKSAYGNSDVEGGHARRTSTVHAPVECRSSEPTRKRQLSPTAS